MNIWQLTGIIHDVPAVIIDNGVQTLTFTLKNTEDKWHKARVTFVNCMWPYPPRPIVEAFKPHTLVYLLGNGTLAKREWKDKEGKDWRTNSLGLLVLEGSVAGEALPPTYSNPRKAYPPPDDSEDAR